ncbi:hypothetical protein B4U78_009340 [Microbacterium esteraromaticum]|nr:hypothetical protein B4U78_009340 [Microbacterium esteraromaticum]
MGTCFRIVGGGVTAFAVTFISVALMKMFGQPLIDQLPAGDWGMDRLRDAGHWLLSAYSAFWLAAAGTAAFALWFARRASVTRTTTWNVVLWLLGGLVVGVIVTLTRAVPLDSAWADSATWLLAASYVMPLLTAVLWWTAPLAVEGVRSRLQARRAQAARLASSTASGDAPSM